MITMRRARPSEASQLTRIAHAAKRHWGYPEELIRRWGPDLTVTAGLVAHEPVYCALRGRKVVGFYGLSGTGTARELEHMWVDPRFLGRGVGTRMFAHLVWHLRQKGVTRLAIASDPNAEGFYRRMGARRVGRVASVPRGRYLPRLRFTPSAAAGSGSTRARRR
jgi:GNAT superfamily N-acetyltransferase